MVPWDVGHIGIGSPGAPARYQGGYLVSERLEMSSTGILKPEECFIEAPAERNLRWSAAPHFWYGIRSRRGQSPWLLRAST